MENLSVGHGKCITQCACMARLAFNWQWDGRGERRIDLSVAVMTGASAGVLRFRSTKHHELHALYIPAEDP